jgi:hypothetical protein
MRWVMLKRVAWWSNQNRVSLKWRWLARLRPSERFFWSAFAKGDLGKDWRRVLELERCICAERLEVLSALFARRDPPLSERDENTADVERCDAALAKIRARIEKRALQPDSHWQLSYNLGCFYAIRAERLSGDEADECKRTGLDWLERSLDRPASTQLVREWVVADGDLDALRDLPQFARWSLRVAGLSRQTAPES